MNKDNPDNHVVATTAVAAWSSGEEFEVRRIGFGRLGHVDNCLVLINRIDGVMVFESASTQSPLCLDVVHEPRPGREACIDVVDCDLL